MSTGGAGRPGLGKGVYHLTGIDVSGRLGYELLHTAQSSESAHIKISINIQMLRAQSTAAIDNDQARACAWQDKDAHARRAPTQLLHRT